MKHFFRGGLLLPLHLLVLIPLMQFSATSGIFTAMGIPDFLAYYITKKDFLLPIYVGVNLLCCLLSVRWIFSTPLFVEYRCSFRSARKCSRKLVKGRFWKTLFSVLLWNCFYFAVMLLSLCAITAVVLLIVKLRNSGTSLTTQAMQVFKILVQVVLWSFSFFATPIYVTYVTTLFQKRREQFPEVELPEPYQPDAKQTRPFRRVTAVVTALVLTLSALGLNVSYLYSLLTGQSTLWVTFYQDPMIMAHRGLSADALENTLYAFAAAIDVGANFIELDVQQTKDGVLIVMHDQSLLRTTGVDKNIWEVDYDEIKDLDAGSWFDLIYGNAHISTLEEVLQFVDGRIQLNIEIKPTDYSSDTLEQDVAELIEKYDYTDKYWVTSFSYTSLKKIKQVNSAIKTAYVMSMAYGQFYNLQYADRFSLNKVFVINQVVNAVHQNGKQVFAWTVNSISEARSLCNLQVDGIITDDPEMVQEVVAEDYTESLCSILDYLLN